MKGCEKIMIKFDFSSFPVPLSGKVVNYICPKCKEEFEAPTHSVLEFEQEDELNELSISTPPYAVCPTYNHDKCVPIDYKSKKGFHHRYKE